MTYAATHAQSRLSVDPLLSAFPVVLEENKEQGLWELLGWVPLPALKMRAGTIAHTHLPSGFRLRNSLDIQPSTPQALGLGQMHGGSNHRSGAIKQAA